MYINQNTFEIRNTLYKIGKPKYMYQVGHLQDVITNLTDLSGLMPDNLVVAPCHIVLHRVPVLPTQPNQQILSV